MEQVGSSEVVQVINAVVTSVLALIVLINKFRKKW
jgi:hypothetical protein